MGTLGRGREVFATRSGGLPGSELPHRMIREGARLVTSAADIMEDMGWQHGQGAEQLELPMPDLTNQQRRLYDALCDEPRGFDELLELLEVPAPQLNVMITQLELFGLIIPSGRMFRGTEMTIAGGFLQARSYKLVIVESCQSALWRVFRKGL